MVECTREVEPGSSFLEVSQYILVAESGDNEMLQIHKNNIYLKSHIQCI